MAENKPVNSQTLVIESNHFAFETVSDENGYATVVKFKLENPQVIPGDETNHVRAEGAFVRHEELPRNGPPSTPDKAAC